MLVGNILKTVLNSVQGQGTQIFTNKSATEKNKTHSLESSLLPYISINKPIYRLGNSLLHVEKQSIATNWGDKTSKLGGIHKSYKDAARTVFTNT